MRHTELKYLSESREQRAKAILEKGQPIILNENTYLIPSQFSSRKYMVTHFDSYSCNCKDFELRCKGKGLYCKHIKAIILFEKVILLALKGKASMHDAHPDFSRNLLLSQPV